MTYFNITCNHSPITKSPIFQPLSTNNIYTILQIIKVPQTFVKCSKQNSAFLIDSLHGGGGGWGKKTIKGGEKCHVTIYQQRLFQFCIIQFTARFDTLRSHTIFQSTHQIHTFRVLVLLHFFVLFFVHMSLDRIFFP